MEKRSFALAGLFRIVAPQSGKRLLTVTFPTMEECAEEGKPTTATPGPATSFRHGGRGQYGGKMDKKVTMPKQVTSERNIGAPNSREPKSNGIDTWSGWRRRQAAMRS